MERADFMRTLERNKQRMYYANQDKKIPLYEKNLDGSIKYIEIDGESVAIPTGDFKMTYSQPAEFYGSISFSGRETQAVEFGIDVSDYDATLVLDKNSLKLTETSLIWCNSEILYKDEEKTVLDTKSADYRVKKVTPSINVDKYLLERIVK